MKKKCIAIPYLALASALFASSLANADDIVMVMATAATPVTKDEIANVYLGRSNEFTPLDLPESNPIRALFYKRATDRDAAQIKSVWSRIVFTGQGRPPKEMPDAAAVKKAVAADSKAIGYIARSDVDSSVTVVFTLH